MARDHLLHQRAVAYVPRQRPYLVQTRGVGDESIPTYATIGRLQPDAPAHRGRLPDRASRIRAEGQKRLIGHHRRRRSATRAPGDPLQVTRVARDLVGRVLRGRAHGELVHIGLTDERHACFPAPGHNGCIVGGHEALQYLRGACRSDAARAEDILRRIRHAGQRPQCLTCGPGLIDCPGLLQRHVLGQLQVGIDVAFYIVNALELALDGIDRRGLLLGQLLRQLMRLQLMQFHVTRLRSTLRHLPPPS